MTVAGGGTLDLNGFNQTVSGLTIVVSSMSASVISLAGFARQAIEPNSGVYLEQRWVARHRRHCQTGLYRLFLSAERRLAAALQKGLGIELAKNVDETGDDPGPSRLMAGADSGAVVAMEVFIEQ